MSPIAKHRISPSVRFVLLFFAALRTKYVVHGSIGRHGATVEDHIKNDDDYYVFLQKFPLQNTQGFIFHTEVLVCPKSGFSEDDQGYINSALEDTSIIKRFPLIGGRRGLRPASNLGTVAACAAIDVVRSLTDPLKPTSR